MLEASSEVILSDPASLVWRVGEHDERAFELLYKNFQRYVFTMARQLVRSDFEAEEVLQDVFLALWVRPPEIPHGLPSFLAWLSVTTRNQCWMKHRGRQRECSSTGAAGDCQELVYPASLLETIIEAELRGNLERAVRRAPEKHRDVLNLAYYEDIGATEIASRLHLPVVTVRKRMDAAVAQLRRALQRAGGLAEAGGRRTLRAQ